MSVLFFKQLEHVRKTMHEKIERRDNPIQEKEIAQTKTFLQATSDPKWKKQLQKRLDDLTGKKKGEAVDVEADKVLLKLLDAVYEHTKDRKEFTRKRKRRTSTEKE